MLCQIWFAFFLLFCYLSFSSCMPIPTWQFIFHSPPQLLYSSDFYLTIISSMHGYQNYSGFMNTPKEEIKNIGNVIKQCALLGAYLTQNISIYSTAVYSTLCGQSCPFCHLKVAISCYYGEHHYPSDSLWQFQSVCLISAVLPVPECFFFFFLSFSSPKISILVLQPNCFLRNS